MLLAQHTQINVTWLSLLLLLFAFGPPGLAPNSSKWKVLNKKFISLIKAMQQTPMLGEQCCEFLSIPCCSYIYVYIYKHIRSTHDKLSNRELRASKPKSPNFISRYLPAFPNLSVPFLPLLLLWQLQKTFSLFFKSPLSLRCCCRFCFCYFI